MTGRVTIVGLGPGSDDLVTPEVTSALAQATDVVGYIPYVKRIPPRDGLTLLQECCGDARPVIFARAVSTPEEELACVPLTEATPEMADMRTVVIVGSSLTRVITRSGAPLIYTPRSVLDTPEGV